MATAMRRLATHHSSARESPVEALLRELVDLQRQILAALEQRQRPTQLTREEEARFVLVVALAVRGRAFNAAELLAHGRVDADLRQALGGLTSRQIGKRLRTLADRDIGGLIVRRIKRDDAGTVWTVSVADLHADTGAEDDRRA